MNEQERKNRTRCIAADELIILGAMVLCVFCAAGALLLAFGG